VGDRIAKCDIVELEFAGIDMQAAADFTGGNFSNAANRRDDSRKHGRPCFAHKRGLYHARLTARLAQKQVWP